MRSAYVGFDSAGAALLALFLRKSVLMPLVITVTMNGSCYVFIYSLALAHY